MQLSARENVCVCMCVKLCTVHVLHLNHGKCQSAVWPPWESTGEHVANRIALHVSFHFTHTDKHKPTFLILRHIMQHNYTSNVSILDMGVDETLLQLSQRFESQESCGEKKWRGGGAQHQSKGACEDDRSGAMADLYVALMTSRAPHQSISKLQTPSSHGHGVQNRHLEEKQKQNRKYFEKTWRVNTKQ